MHGHHVHGHHITVLLCRKVRHSHVDFTKPELACLTVTCTRSDAALSMCSRA